MKFKLFYHFINLVLLNLIIGHVTSEHQIRDEVRSHLQHLKSKAETRYHMQKQKAWTQCSIHPQSMPILQSGQDSSARPELGTSQFGSSRVRRTVLHYSRMSDHSILLTSSKGYYVGSHDQKLPEHEFTLAIWCKPEGGQVSPAIIFEAVDSCIPFPDRGWVLGIRSADTQIDKDMRIYFSLHTWSKREAVSLVSPISFVPRTWIHVAVTYNGQTLTLYLNGVQVAVSEDQASPPPTRPPCRILWIGGDTGSHYRGTLDDLKIWNVALMSDTIQKIVGDERIPNPILEDNFSKLDLWDWNDHRGKLSKFRLPHLILSDIPVHPQPVQAKPNPCGHTICDSPDIVDNYKNQWILRKPKTLRYRVVIVTENDGTNPTVTKNQVRAQHEFLQKAFKPYNISWELDEVNVKNSSLRERSVLLNCYTNMVGNGVCDPECRQVVTGNDGGDCESFALFRRQNHLFYDDDDMGNEYCGSELIGNGQCDDVCNVRAHSFDGGDCCLESNLNCFDPDSPNRSYLDVMEFKSLLKLSTNQYINVFFAHWSRRDMLGVATFPWQKDVLSEQGGVILQPLGYGIPGQMTTLVHEMGHVLGLWHVHRGVSEIDCVHQCYEKESSLIHGDLCADTEPTPENFHCYDLQNSTQSICGKSKFEATPYSNYMGYGDDTCAEEFTPDQVARMHCYIDLVYSSTIHKGRDAKPSPASLLTAISSTKSSVTISWLPPISTVNYYDTNICSFCSDALEFSQYGYRAEHNAIQGTVNSMFSPTEATGPPDAEPCIMSHKLWLPEENDCPNNICTLTIYFKTPVVPSLLQIWVSWIAYKELEKVELEFQDGTRNVITGLVAQCDTPLTIPVFYDKAVTKIFIHTEPMIVGIDAVKIVSIHGNRQCSPCKPLRYRVYRNPPFKDGKPQELDYPMFTDTTLHQNKTFEYRVQTWLGNKMSDLSPPYFFHVGLALCGNGIIDQNETCDDGNLKDHDGCSSLCERERFFNCNGEPSVCYVFEDDGHCEHFEQTTSVSDCGFFTPKGFTDQWAHQVEIGSNWLFGNIVPEQIIGAPSLPLKCQSQNLDSFWSHHDEDAKFWLVAQFPKPVVATMVILYLSSDGNKNAAKATLQLYDLNGLMHHQQGFDFSCDKIPQEIPIFKDLSLPFGKTASVNLTFTNENVAISALRLRSSNILNPPDIEACSARQLYHPKLQKCQEYCAIVECQPLRVKHARLKCSGHRDGDTCDIQCDVGYKRQENLEPSVCLGGQWHGAESNCKPVDCGMPLLAHADVNCPDGTTFSKTCSFKCLKPARFNDSSHGLATTECKDNGIWSTPSLTCQLTCSLPSFEAHTTLVSSKCKRKGIFYFGENCRFLCKVGYHVEGYKIRKRNLRLHCDLTGSWSGPKCVPVTCPLKKNISYNCTMDNTAGSQCEISCLHSKKVTPSYHDCKVDGTWNPSVPECQEV